MRLKKQVISFVLAISMAFAMMPDGIIYLQASAEEIALEEDTPEMELTDRDDIIQNTNSINISNVVIAGIYYNVNDNFPIYVEYATDGTLKSGQRKDLFLEVTDKDSGIVVASGASDVSENYFSIPSCSNIEAGKNYTLVFVIKYKDPMNGQEIEIWNETKDVKFEEKNAWSPYQYLPTGEVKHSLYFNVITDIITTNSIINGIYLFDKNGKAVAGTIGKLNYRPGIVSDSERKPIDIRYNGIFSKYPSFSNIAIRSFNENLYFARKLNAGEEFYVGYSVDGKLQELKNVKFIATDRPYITGIYQDTDLYLGMEDCCIMEIKGYNIDFKNLSFILKEPETDKTVATVVSAMSQNDKASYIVKWADNYQPLENINYRIEFSYSADGAELINEMAKSTFSYNQKSSNIIWNPKTNSIEYYNNEIPAGTIASYELWDGNREYNNSKCCASGGSITASDGNLIKIQLEEKLKGGKICVTGVYDCGEYEYIEYQYGYCLYLTYKDTNGVQKEISDGVYIYDSEQKNKDKEDGKENNGEIYPKSLENTYFLYGSETIGLSAKFYCKDISKLADTCDAVIYDRNNGEKIDNIELMLNNKDKSLSYDTEYKKQLPVGNYKLEISLYEDKKLIYYFYVKDNNRLCINSQSNHIYNGVIWMQFNSPELADLYYKDEYLNKVTVKICDIQNKEIGTYNYLDNFTIVQEYGGWNIQFTDEVKKELSGVYYCYAYIYYDNREIEKEYYKNSVQYHSLYEEGPLYYAVCYPNEEKNSWLAMCYSNNNGYRSADTSYKNNDKYSIPSSPNMGTMGGFYYGNGFINGLKVNEYYENGKCTCNSVYGSESAFPAVIEIADWYSLKTIKEINIPKSGYYLTASDLSGLEETSLYHCYLKGADGSVSGYFGYLNEGHEPEPSSSPSPSPSAPGITGGGGTSGSGGSGGGSGSAAGGGGGAPATTPSPAPSVQPEETPQPVTTKAPESTSTPDNNTIEDANSTPENTNSPGSVEDTGNTDITENNQEENTFVSSKGKLVLKKTKLTLKPGQKSKVKITSKINTKVTYKSLNPSVATVSKKGVITAKKAGKAVITVKANGKKRKVTVTVKKSKGSAGSSVIVNLNKSLKLSKAAVSIKKGNKFTIKKASGIKGKVKFVSANKKVASVSVNGVVKAKKKGKTTILIKTAKKTVKLKVTVTR